MHSRGSDLLPDPGSPRVYQSKKDHSAFPGVAYSFVVCPDEIVALFRLGENAVCPNETIGLVKFVDEDVPTSSNESRAPVTVRLFAPFGRLAG